MADLVYRYLLKLAGDTDYDDPVDDTGVSEDIRKMAASDLAKFKKLDTHWKKNILPAILNLRARAVSENKPEIVDLVDQVTKEGRGLDRLLGSDEIDSYSVERQVRLYDQLSVKAWETSWVEKKWAEVQRLWRHSDASTPAYARAAYDDIWTRFLKLGRLKPDAFKESNVPYAIYGNRFGNEMNRVLHLIIQARTEMSQQVDLEDVARKEQETKDRDNKLQIFGRATAKALDTYVKNVTKVLNDKGIIGFEGSTFAPAFSRYPGEIRTSRRISGEGPNGAVGAIEFALVVSTIPSEEKSDLTVILSGLGSDSDTKLEFSGKKPHPSTLATALLKDDRFKVVLGPESQVWYANVQNDGDNYLYVGLNKVQVEQTGRANYKSILESLVDSAMENEDFERNLEDMARKHSDAFYDHRVRIWSEDNPSATEHDRDREMVEIEEESYRERDRWLANEGSQIRNNKRKEEQASIDPFVELYHGMTTIENLLFADKIANRVIAGLTKKPTAVLAFSFNQGHLS